LIPLLSGTADGIGLGVGDLITGFDGVSITIGEGDTTAILGFCMGDGFGLEAGEFSIGGSVGVSMTIGEGEATIRFGFGLSIFVVGDGIGLGEAEEELSTGSGEVLIPIGVVEGTAIFGLTPPM